MDSAGATSLVIMCRRPAPGIGKQRLARELGQQDALAAAELLLGAALEDARDWPGPVFLAPADPADEAWACGLLDRPVRVIPQPPGNLGSRINAVDQAARRLGASRLIFIGTDAPGLDPGYFEAARRALDRQDVVLGPARDGGVTLMGAREPWPDLADLPWSTGELGAALEAACDRAGRGLVRLSVSGDVDLAADLARAHGELAGDPRAARRALHDWIGHRLERIAAATPKRSSALSIVVPVMHDLGPLADLLQRLGQMVPAPAEVIVVDGAPGPAGEALCAEHGCIYLPSRAGRGSQNRAGAARATGQVLWFLHADAAPAPDATRLITAAIGDGAVGGCFRFRFNGQRTLPRRMLAGLINARACIGTPYGDQGLFASREAYDAAGGFADEPLFEEVPLVRELRRLGEFRMLPAAIGVSPRRWERDGWVRRSLANRALALGYAIGIPARILARRYHPQAKEESA